ncbi:hypothetical protein RJ55_06033 [Drechmeria coniospora]|nr:hypothetical protein RJ55_06033 [Drechmeria coniospora]
MTNRHQTTAASWLLLSVAHTASANQWQSLPAFRSLSNLTYACAKAGWYQGSGFFVLCALTNCGWSKNPELLREPVHKAMAALMVAIMWASSAWYARQGVRPNAVAVGTVGALQLYSAFI